MHVARLELINWGPFAGEHAVDLGPGLWAIIGRHDADPGRSNWLGKTWCMHAIRFALYGEHPAATEDEWISRGKDTGAVSIRLNTGEVITRTRPLGGPTALRLDTQHGEAKGKHAQEQIDRLVGMVRADFDAGVWIGQREVARIVLATPGDRAALVEGWAGLQQLQAAEDRAKSTLRDAVAKASTAAPTESVATLEAQIASVAEQIKAAEADAAKARAAMAAVAEYARHAERARRYEAVVLEGKALAAEIDAAPEVPDLAALATAEDRARKVRETTIGRLSALRIVSDFDGTCPVGRFACPAADQVHGQVHRAQADRNEAEVENKRAADDAAKAATARREADGQASRLTQDETRLERLREQAADLYPSVEWLAGKPAPEAPQTAETIELVARLGRDRDHATRSLRTAREAEAGRVSAAQAVTIWRAAVAVLRAARREIGAQAVAEVQTGANALLADAGVGLRIEVRWERETQQLAVACAECGERFPKSAAIKQCQVCGAPRGPKLSEGLELLPSDRSGAADDLAGLAFQLSAAAWLRRRRSSPWGVVLVDEPFGQLDERHREQLAAHLHRLLGGRYGFEQALVVAHDAALMEALPHRIVVRSDGRTSRLEVE